jgi:hypothetical protein
MRTPEQKHYDNEDLNVAYVYSDLAGATVKIVADEPDFDLRDTTITRGPGYPATNLKLRSVFQPRRRDFHYPDVATLEPVLKDQLNERVLPLLGKDPVRETRREVLVDATLDAKSILGGRQAEFDGAFVDGILGDQFVQALFDQVLTSKIGDYRSREQSRSRIKTLLVKWFQSVRQWEPDEIQHFVLAHASVVSAAIDAACYVAARSEEAKAVAEARSKRRTTDEWEIPASELVASKGWESASAKGCLFVPPLVPTNRSEPERRFERWLGAEVDGGRVSWWWKNGVRDEKYLGVPYTLIDPVTKVSTEEITYPDYVVLAVSGEVWAIEVKDINDPEGKEGGVTACKARGLRDWADAMNKARTANKQLLGLPPVRAGVVVPSDEGTENANVKIGSPEDWKEPTPANHSIGVGWTPINFDGNVAR